MTPLCLFYWIPPRRSTTQHLRDFSHTSSVGDSTSISLTENVPAPLTSSAACHKNRSLGQYISIFTLLIWRQSLQNMICRCINMPTIIKYTCMTLIRPLPLPRCRLSCHSVSTASQAGCGRIASNLMPIRQVMCCLSTRKLFQLPAVHFELLAPLAPFETWKFLSTTILEQLPTFGEPCHARYFAALRQLRHLRRYITDDCFCSLVVSLVHSRLDCGNFTVELPAYLQQYLQSLINAAARLVFRLRCYDHVTVGRSCNSALAAPARTGRL